MLGRFGPYVQLGETPTDKKADKPRRASLGRNFSEDTITLDEALQLLSLPRELGAADDGEAIVANIGRFGPYVKHGDEFRSLAPEDDVYTITLERAKELLAQEKKSMRRQRAAAKELRALGAHPDSGAPVRVLDGRYGPYVTDGETNASLPKGTAPDALTMDEAKALLAARAGAAKAARRGRAAKKAGAGRRRRRRRSAGAAARADSSDRAFMIHIIGGGLAGSEAAWQAAELGVPVTIHEMRPVRPTAVHKTDGLAELVCSNSFRGDKLDNAVGLLKEEMRRLGSLIMRAADAARVPAGAALAVDRVVFSAARHGGASRVIR